MTDEVFYIDPDSYYATLRALKALDKETTKELRRRSKLIAEDILKPKIQAAIISHAGPYGPKLARSVRVKGDRVPMVLVGAKGISYGATNDAARKRYYQKRARLKKAGFGVKSAKEAGLLSDIANTVMLRYGTIEGPYKAGREGKRAGEIQHWARQVTPGWTMAASNDYLAPTFHAWEQAVLGIIDDWNNGVRYGA
jgi:hypothetical protein